MTMKDWIDKLDEFLKISGRNILKHAGTISHNKALQKAHKEFEKYRAAQLAEPSGAEKDFLEAEKKVKILGKTFTPQTLVIPNTEPTQFKKVVAVEGQEWAFYEAKAYIILDKTGREILPDQVPIAPSEDNPTKLLKEFKNKTEHLKLSNKELVTMVKDKLINKPSDIDTIDNELFQISEHAVIYNPIYVITFQNVKTNEEKSVHIDGVTGDIIV